MSNAQSQFEIFISYARRDDLPQKSGDAKGWVTALRDELLRDQQRFSTEPLRIFFDTLDIKSMDAWRDRILSGLRQSRILMVCVSSSYFQRPPCLWEWDEYAKRQVHALLGYEGIAPVYLLNLPDSEECRKAAWAEGLKAGVLTESEQPEWEERWSHWHSDVRRYQFVDLRPYVAEGVAAVGQTEVRRRINALGTSLWERIRRARRASSAPGNLRRPNPHFIGRSKELRELHRSLGLGAVGVVTAIHGLGGQGKTELATAYAHGWADSYPTGLWVLVAEGRKEILPLMGELCSELDLPLLARADETGEERGRRVLAELKRRALATQAPDAQRGDAESGGACLIQFDDVSEPALLSEPQIANLPREDWLHVVATTRLGEEMFAASRKKSLAFVAVDALADEDAERLIEDHQSGGQWPSGTATADAAATREIVRELGGFTLAIESVAIYLGLHPEIRPADYLARLVAEGAPSVDSLPADADVAVQIQHREKRLQVVLDQTLSRLTAAERTALDYGSLLPPDSIPWPWLRSLVETEYKEALAATPGYPDPWLSLHRRMEGLRLLTAGDIPETARMHRLVGATLAQRMPQGARAEKLDQLARFLCNAATPFGYGLPIEVFLRAWRLIGEAQPLTERFMGQAGGIENVSPDLAEKWTDLSYQLGDSVLEEWWLMRWAGEGPTNHAYAQRRASLMHRQGDTEGAAHLLREHLQSCGENFDTSIRLIMYLSQLGRHQDAEALAGEVATRHAALLSKNPLRRAEFLHCRYFILHDLEKNSEAVEGCRFMRDTYVQNHLTYDSLIATVNLGDALWAVGKPHEAAGLLRSALADAQSSGLAQVENIAAICLGNVLSSIGSHAEAARCYELGLAVTHRIGHRWDLLYAQNYQALHDVELRKASCAVFSQIRKAAAEAGLGYLAELVDAHICIASFTEQADESHLQEAMDRGLRSIFPAVRLYALSALIRRQLALDHATDAGKIREWVSALEAVEGIKGRIGVIARTAEWLLETGRIATIDVARVRDWFSRYVPDSLSEYFRTQYRSPIENRMANSNSAATTELPSAKCVHLRVCNLNECEALCCYDGVYLENGEEERIREVVASAPDFFDQLPADFVVDGSWDNGRVSGRKTATRPHEFKIIDLPAHFNRTRCVFCSDDNKCLFQVLAVQRGLHKWTYKPKACWMFPMRIVDHQPAPPPAADEPDPDCLGEHYPGYAKFVPCGQDRSDGDPWDVTLSDEIAFWKKEDGL